MPIIFEIQQHSDCWSFRTTEHGLHMGYPDALQATAAAMRAFSELPRVDVLISDLEEIIKDVQETLSENKPPKPKLTLISND